MPHFSRYTDGRCHHVAPGMLTPRKVKSRHVGCRHNTEGRQHCITLQHRDGLGKQPTSARSSWHMFWFNLIPSQSTLLTHNHTCTNLSYWEPDYLSHCFNSWTTTSKRVKSGKTAIGIYRPIRKFIISVPNTMPQGPQQPLAQTLAEGNQMFHQVVNDSVTLGLFPPIRVTTRRIISLPGDRS